MTLQKDLSEFIGLLNSSAVEYLVVGAHALAFYGVSRYTGDLDLLVRVSETNAQKLATAIHSFGFADTGLSEKDFLGGNEIIQLGLPPNRIDLLTAMTGIRFEDAWQARVSGALGDHAVFFIGRPHFIQNKRALGRPKDLSDLELLDS